ncbi:MAG: hypothetical protein LC687_06870 [Actinobacteria bacterium]|nr:hypothetical protein [Actinomycetota bacterium]
MGNEELLDFDAIVNDIEIEDPYKEYRLEISRTILALTEAATWLGSLLLDMNEEDQYDPIGPDAFEHMNSIIHDGHMLCEIIASHTVGDELDQEDD